MNIIKFLLIIVTFLSFIPNINAKDLSTSSIVMDIDSGRIIYQNNPHEKKLIASTTKIMTAIIAIEQGKLDKKVKIGEEILKMYGTNIYIEVGEEMTLEDLLYGLILRSGNDASVAIATAISGSEDKFVLEMNKKAKEIGMTNTIFSNPHGLDEETKNYSTAYDMALLMKYAYQNKVFRKISSTKKYTVSTPTKTYLWYNRNKLLSTYEYCTGGKNGYTPSAGKTFVSTATKDNLNLIAVSLNDGDIYTTHETLLENAFSKYQNYKIIDKNNFNVTDESNNKLYIKKDFYYPLTQSELNKIKTVVYLKNINSTQKGVITIYLKKEKIGSIPIYKENTQPKKESLFSKLKKLFIR